MFVGVQETPLLKYMKYLIDELNEKRLNNYTPEENIAIDEYLPLWKCHVFNLEYIYRQSESELVQNFSCFMQNRIFVTIHYT